MVTKSKQYASEGRSAKKLWFVLSRMTKRIWFRSALYAAISVVTAFIGYFGKFYISESFVTKIGSDSVGNVLAILASSMLTVATFSLSIMVTAFGQVASGATPRAASLLIEDQKSQSAVATFIGAFLYSIVGLVTLSTGIYGTSGRFLLFLVTVAVIIWIIATLIRWVDQLATLGRVGDTIKKIENATSQALTQRAERPYLGGRRLDDEQRYSFSVFSDAVGFVSFIDVQAIQQACEELKIEIQLRVLPGSFVYPGRAVAIVNRGLTENEATTLSDHFVVEASRSFQQDPRFGFITLTEIASRALSPAVNDPGTAIEVMGACVRLFSHWSRSCRACSKENSTDESAEFPRVTVPALKELDLLRDVFGPIARDGAGMVEVGIKLQRSLQALSAFDPPRFSDAAQTLSRLALEQSDNKLATDSDRERVQMFALSHSLAQ